MSVDNEKQNSAMGSELETESRPSDTIDPQTTQNVKDENQTTQEASSSSTSSKPIASPTSQVEIEDVTQEEEEKTRQMLKAQKLERQESIGLGSSNDQNTDSSPYINRRLTNPKTAIEYATELKEKGNRAFQQADFNMAYEEYTAALAAIHFIQPYSFADNNEEDAKLQDQWKQLRINLHSNIAACCLMKKDFDGVILHTTEVLQLDPNHLKALTRRGKAYASTGEDGLAMIDLLRASKLGGDAIKKEVDPFIYTIQKRMLETVKSEKRKAKEEKEKLKKEKQKQKERENVRRFAELFEKSMQSESDPTEKEEKELKDQDRNETFVKPQKDKVYKQEKTTPAHLASPSTNTSASAPTVNEMRRTQSDTKKSPRESQNDTPRQPAEDEPTNLSERSERNVSFNNTDQPTPDNSNIDQFFKQLFGQLPQRSPYHTNQQDRPVTQYSMRSSQSPHNAEVVYPTEVSSLSHNVGQQFFNPESGYIPESDESATDTESEDESALDQLLRTLQRSAYEGKAREDDRISQRRNAHLMNIENKLSSVINDKLTRDPQSINERYENANESRNEFPGCSDASVQQRSIFSNKQDDDEDRNEHDQSNHGQAFIVSYPSDDELEIDTRQGRTNNISSLPEAETENDLLNAMFLSLLGIHPRSQNQYEDDSDSGHLSMPLLSSLLLPSFDDNDDYNSMIHNHLYGDSKMSRPSPQTRYASRGSTVSNFPAYSKETVSPFNALWNIPSSSSMQHATHRNERMHHHHPSADHSSPYVHHHSAQSAPYMHPHSSFSPFGLAQVPYGSVQPSYDHHNPYASHIKSDVFSPFSSPHYPFSSPLPSFQATAIPITSSSLATPASAYSLGHFPVDILEFEPYYQIDAFMPVPREARKNIRVNVDDINILHISCPQLKPSYLKHATILSAESPFYQTLHRAIPLPRNSIPERLSTEFHDGRLTVLIPKRQFFMNHYH